MKKHLFKSMVGAVAALSLSFGLAACGSGGSSSGATGEKSIVTVYNVEPQNKMIPGNVNENAGARVLDLIFAGLVTFDRNGIPHNEVAQSIKASKNNTFFTINLKSGWKFNDGTPVTASSFTKAWSYTANATNAQLNASFFSVIKGYDALQRKGVSPQAQLSGLKVVNDRTFTVELNKPSQVFSIMLGYIAFVPMPESFYKDPKAFGENPVGDGPYKFKSWTHNRSIEVVRNKDYHGFLKPKNAGITFKIYTDKESAYSDVRSGNLDVMDTVPTSALRTFRTDTSLKSYNKAGSRIETVTFSPNLKHFGNDKEGILRRRAVSLAIDRQQIASKVFSGVVTPATDFVSPPISGHTDKLKGGDVLTYNPSEAKKLWAQANAISPWTSSDSIVLSYNSDGGTKDVFDAIANQLTNTLKVKATTNPVATFNEFRNEINQRKLVGVFRTGWMPDYPSAEDYLNPIYSSEAADGKGSNDGDYKNPKFDAILSQAAGVSSTAKANKLYQQGEEILLAELPTIPLYYYNNYGVTTSGVSGYYQGWDSFPRYEDLQKN